MHYAELLKARQELTGPGGEFEIVEAEVLGNTLRVYKNAPPSVREVWQSTKQFADRTYLVYKDERLTYAEAHDHVNAVAAWLFDQGVQPGDRVRADAEHHGTRPRNPWFDHDHGPPSHDDPGQ